MYTLTITEAAKRLSRTVKTLQRWDRDKILVAQRTQSNRRYYTDEQLRKFLNAPIRAVDKSVVAYCRVSSQAQRPDLVNQRAVLEQFCIGRGLGDVEYVQEIGGGLNLKRPLLCELVRRIVNGEVDTVVAAHKDRIARFGFDLFKHICDLQDCKVILLNSETLSPEREVVEDLMAIVHCFSSRLYGLRNYKKDLKKALSK